MVSLSWSMETRDGVTLVTATLTGGTTRQALTLTCEVAGPVWPPRQNGELAPGWEDASVRKVVPPGEQVGVGFATPADPANPPVSITDQEVVAADEPDRSIDEATPAAALRQLRDPAPPRDAVPLPSTTEQRVTAGRAADGGSPPALAGTDEEPTDEPTGEPDRNPRPANRRLNGELAPPCRAWLERVADRVEQAEQLAAAETLPEATDAMHAVGGIDGAKTLEGELQADAATLAAVADRADALASRAGAVTVPLQQYERLA
jgi:hypothetical protein